MNIIGITISVGLTLWWIATVVLQVNLVTNLHKNSSELLPKWKECDILHILPCSIFFSVPPEADYLVLYRDKNYSHPNFGPWKLLDFPKSSVVIRWLWNPSYVQALCLDDYASKLVKVLLKNADQLDEKMLLTPPYIGVKVYVSSLDDSLYAQIRQFIIIRSSNQSTPRLKDVLFISPEFEI